MKILVIIVHPQLSDSRVNKRWKQALQLTDNVTVHDLYEQYPEGRIDVQHEQELLETHDRIILQFPFYWYSAPPFLYKWITEVFTSGWAYGRGGKALNGKELVLAVSVGGPQHSYMAGGYNNYTISELTRPLQATAYMTWMHFMPHFVQHGATVADDEAIDRSAEAYVNHITNEDLNPQTRLAKLMQKFAGWKAAN